MISNKKALKEGGGFYGKRLNLCLDFTIPRKIKTKSAFSEFFNAKTIFTLSAGQSK